VHNSLALALLAGLLSAGLYLPLISGLAAVVLFAYFVQLPLMFIGLTIGFAGSIVAAAAGVVACAVVAGVLAAAVYGALQAVPAVFVVRQALLSRPSEDGGVEWFPPGLLLAQLALIAALGIVLGFLALSTQPGGFSGTIERLLAVALAELGAVAEQDATMPEGNRWLFLFPGLMAASWLIMVTLNFLIAQALAVRVGWNRRPSPDFDALELPWWLWPCLGAAVLLSLLGTDFGVLGRAVLITLVVPYVFLGLAVLHTLARRWSQPGLALTVIYGTIVIFGWPILLVLLLGFVEDWAGVRRRLS